MVQHIWQHVNNVFHARRHRIDFIDIFVHKVCNLCDKYVSRINRAVRIGLHFVHIALHAVARGVHVVNRLFYDIVQFIDRIAQRLRLVNLDKRLHLSHNAADIFSAVDRSAVCAQGDDSRLAPCDAADIVACVLIPHGSGIGTA